MLPTVLAVALAVVLAWWSWRGRLGSALARGAAAARFAGLTALLLLLVDPGMAGRRGTTRPLILLDNSVSMHAAGGRTLEAATLAASLGDTASFGELTPGEPGGRSELHDALATAAAAGRAVTVVTDGEITDASTIPADILDRITVRLLPRPIGPDIGLVDVQAPSRITVGDTLTMDLEAQRNIGAPDTALVVVRDSTTVLLHGVLRFGGGTRARLHLTGALPHMLPGEHWLQIARTGPADSEPGDDLRWWKLFVAPTPGVVVVAETPDWDSRALYRTLKDVVDVPIRGFAQLQHGVWRRMDNLHSVSLAEVMAAAKGADLLAVRGDVQTWRAMGKARLLWPLADQPGDWYLTAGGISPLNGAFAGVEADSLPAATGIRVLDGDSSRGWTGATARLSKRGAPVAVIGGHENHGDRTVTIGADGLYRWQLRGGISDQVWRTMLANAATWLLARPEGDSVRAHPVASVAQRGSALHFRWTGIGPPAPLTIQLHGPRGERSDTLRFDGTGSAALALGVGRYRYTLEGGGAGSVAVEPYADELVPSPVTLAAHTGRAGLTAPRRSLRDLLWLFGIAIAGFGGEWMLRRRLGLR